MIISCCNILFICLSRGEFDVLTYIDTTFNSVELMHSDTKPRDAIAGNLNKPGYCKTQERIVHNNGSKFMWYAFCLSPLCFGNQRWYYN